MHTDENKTMEEAFDRLSTIQKENINKNMFIIAYECVVRSNGNDKMLQAIIDKKTEECPHLKSDLLRYCRLVDKIK